MVLPIPFVVVVTRKAPASPRVGLTRPQGVVSRKIGAEPRDFRIKMSPEPVPPPDDVPGRLRPPGGDVLAWFLPRRAHRLKPTDGKVSLAPHALGRGGIARRGVARHRAGMGRAGDGQADGAGP